MAGGSGSTSSRAAYVVLAMVVALFGLAQLGGTARQVQALAATPQSLGAATPATGTDVKYKKVNVELILDSSGSMAEELEDGQTRIEAAKQVLNQVIDALPEQ